MYVVFFLKSALLSKREVALNIIVLLLNVGYGNSIITIFGGPVFDMKQGIIVQKNGTTRFTLDKDF